MNEFWPWIIITLVGVWLGFGLLPDTYHSSWTAGLRLWGLLLMCTLVAVVWAICFRPQVAKLQVSLKAILVLIAMEGMLLAAYSVMRPFGP